MKLKTLKDIDFYRYREKSLKVKLSNYITKLILKQAAIKGVKAGMTLQEFANLTEEDLA